MSAFAVHLEALDDVLDQLGAFQRQAEDALRDLDADAGRLREAWCGAAAGEYAAAHAAWSRDAYDLGAPLAALRRVVATAHGTTRRR
jgi:uncharacterized protein YukE